MVTHTHERERTSPNPASRSPSTCRRPAGAPLARGRTRRSRHALARKVAASTAKAHPAPTAATSPAASAGPTNSATFALPVDSAWASWISSSGTVWGITPP